MTYVPVLDRSSSAMPCQHDSPAFLPLGKSAVVRALTYVCPATAHHGDWDGRHHALSLLLVRQGAFTYRTDRTDALVEPGMVVMALPGEDYGCAHPHGPGDESLVVQVAADLLPADMLPDRHSLGRRVLPASPALAGHLWAAAHRSDPLGRDEAGITALALALNLATSPRHASAPSGEEQTRCHEAAAFIVSHAADPLDIAEIARHVTMSPFMLTRAFGRHLGLSPYRYLITTRLHLAIEHLHAGELSVTEIAYAVGFSDLSNFVRTFHRLVGYPPGTLRRRRARIAK